MWKAPPATRRPQPLTWTLLLLAAQQWPLGITMHRPLLSHPRATAAYLRRVGTTIATQPTPVRADLQCAVRRHYSGAESWLVHNRRSIR